MSTVKSKNLQVGTDATASNNFTIYQPATPDGTLRIGVGNADSPTEVGRFNSSGYVPTNAPAFSAYKSGSAQSISALTATKVTFPTESFDTNSNYDTSTSRFTPTIAGYYQINLLIEALGVTSNFFLAQIRKNGNQWMNGANYPTTSAAGPCSVAAGLVYCNGSTDYIEGFVVSSSALTIPSQSEGLASKFQGVLVRAA